MKKLTEIKTLKDVENIARQFNNGDKLYDHLNDIKAVPVEVSAAFRDKYSSKTSDTPRVCVKRMMESLAR